MGLDGRWEVPFCAGQLRSDIRLEADEGRVLKWLLTDEVRTTGGLPTGGVKVGEDVADRLVAFDSAE